LSTSVQRLSSGLRINSAADDAAGLAIREMMRADIATMNQGIRNTADAISMIQTADGALGVIDEKLVRMKELAEQAATGTYTTAQREIINSEYQAMAAEIDRIANATNFNGIKLLDGSVTNQHGGLGLKIHFGVSNNEAEDYYFVNIGDARATSSTGLRIGGDALNDIWGQGAAGSGPLAGPGCCTAGYTSLDGNAGFVSGQTFSYGYNWDWMEDDDSDLLTGKYLAGRYTVGSSESLQDLIDKVNAGTQSRVGIQMSADGYTFIEDGGTVAVCVGDEAYYWGDTGVAEGGTTESNLYTYMTDAWGQWVSWTATPGTPPVSPTYMISNAQSALFNALPGGPAAPSTVTNATGVTLTASGQAVSAGAAAPLLTQSIVNEASAFNGTQILFISAGATVSLAAGANQIMDFAQAFAQFLIDSNGTYQGTTILGVGNSVTVGLGIYGSGNSWTNDISIASQFGWTERTITLTATTATQTLDDLYNLPASQTAWTNIANAYTNRLTVTGVFNNLVNFDTATVQAVGLSNPNPTGTVVTTNLGMIDSSKEAIQVGDSTNAAERFTAEALASAINHNANSQFWALYQSANSNGDTVEMVYVFAKEGGNLNDLLACDVSASDANSRSALAYIEFENLETGITNQDGTTFTLGGQKWGTMKPIQTGANLGNEVWNVTLNGRDVGDERDLWIAAAGELSTPGLTDDIINGMDRYSFVEIQNAANGPWKGAEVRTQSAAQEALDAISEAINTKDKIRADLGALQNRLENTMTNLTIQAENLQASESRISDVDVATEMTEFTRNNVLAQAATSMLAQANSLSQLALSLIG
jgi:flagellin-like hook-associated protein FlgL